MTPLAWLGILAILLVIEAITVGLTLQPTRPPQQSINLLFP